MRIPCSHDKALLFVAHGERRHRVTFELADGEARELSVVGRLKADGTSCSTRSAVWDIFTVLAYSDWCWVCAGRAARYLASRQGPSEPDNALVFADTRERSKTVARSKLVASSATNDASLANSRVRASRRVELFVLGDGAVRTLQQGCRDGTGELQTRIVVSVAVEVAYLNGQCCCRRLGLVALCASGSAC